MMNPIKSLIKTFGNKKEIDTGEIYTKIEWSYLYALDTMKIYTLTQD